jgi:hypothetical protein
VPFSSNEVGFRPFPSEGGVARMPIPRDATTSLETNGDAIAFDSTGPDLPERAFAPSPRWSNTKREENRPGSTMKEDDVGS